MPSAPWLALGLVLMTSGCSSLVDIRPLATGRADVSAYELTGADLAPLRREAGRLCPQGGEILRQAGRSQMPEKTDGRLQRWLNAGSEWIDPAQRGAQLVVLCVLMPGGHLTAGAGMASAAALATTAAGKPQEGAIKPSTAAAPIGPVNIEW